MRRWSIFTNSRCAHQRVIVVFVSRVVTWCIGEKDTQENICRRSCLTRDLNMLARQTYHRALSQFVFCWTGHIIFVINETNYLSLLLLLETLDARAAFPHLSKWYRILAQSQAESMGISTRITRWMKDNIHHKYFTGYACKRTRSARKFTEKKLKARRIH